MKIFHKLFALAALFFSVTANAQIVITSDFFEKVSYKLETQVVDSLTNEPVSFASVYLMPKKDTLITNFSLTDTLGNAVLKEITRGEYDFHIEFMGYLPYKKSMYIRSDKNLGVIKLKPDLERLEAAKVSAVGEAIEFKQDTIIYNASSFRSLAGDNLGDLLKKMPGIEVGSDGDVKVNGKSVSKITVNGKTFFMGDNKAALDNLPANFVNKVKVTEKDSDKAEFTGIKTGEKETEMDVELKEEYKKGFFGNLKLAGGASVKGKGDNEFVADRPFLYESSTMLSAYGEKNQWTTIANAKNVMTDDVAFMISSSASGSDDLSLGFDGIRSGWSVGSNLNTSAIKGMDSNVSVMFNHDKVDRKSRSDRTTFIEEGEDLMDVQDSEGTGVQNRVNVKFEIENEDDDKYTLYFTPKFEYKNQNESSGSTSSSSVAGDERNHSEAFSSSSMQQYSTAGFLDFGITDLGKEDRSISLFADYDVQKTFGNSTDISSVWFADGSAPTERNLLYDKNNRFFSIYSSLQYVEPLSEYWKLNANFLARLSSKKNFSDAFNADGSANDYFTSVIDNRSTSLGGNVLAQYSKDKFTLYFGAQVDFMETRNFARSYGLETETGKGEWLFNASPYLRLRWTKNKMNYSMYLSSNTSQPSASSMIPSFNIVDPTRLSLGNIYLKQYISNYASINTRGNAGIVRLNVSATAMINTNSQVSATWFDENSIRYTIPVNSHKPQYTLYAMGDVTVPLNKEKTVSITYTPYVNFTRSTGYQAKGILSGIDINKFEYSDFMDSFWGDASGDRFYSGESGFRTSITNQTTTRNSLKMNLNFERFSMTAQASTQNTRSTYSLDSKANTSTWRHTFSLEPEYTAPYEINFSMNLSYRMHRGYTSGYNNDYLNLGLKVQKSFKAFSFALIGSDLFNSAADSHRYSIADDYVQNSYNMIMGRRILLQFTWNFGKMSAAQGRAARSASMNMVW